MYKIIKIMFLFFSLSIYCQNIKRDTIFLLIEKPIISSGLDGSLSFLLVKPSTNTKFICDSYMFSIPNIKNFDEKYKLSEIIKKKEKYKLNKNLIISTHGIWKINNYELHEMFSYYKNRYVNIYLIYDNVEDKNYYNILELFYRGTIKNTEPSPNCFIKK